MQKQYRDYTGNSRVSVMLKRLFLVLIVLWSVVDLLPGQSTDSLVVSENGNVGIGTETPQAKLEVNGNLKAADTQVGVLTATAVNGQINSSQLDYIYAGNQVILDSWAGTLTTTPVELAKAGNYYLLGVPRIPNPDPNQYTLCYYFSSAGGNSNENPCYVFVNGISCLICHTWGTSVWRNLSNSDFFSSWEDFPTVGQFNGLTVTVRTTSGTTFANLWGLTVHYVYIRGGVDYPKLFP